MGQALSFCKACLFKRDCDACQELHDWIMEALEEKAELQAYRDTGLEPEDEDKGGKLIKASDAAEALSEKLNIPMADLVDLFAEIPGIPRRRTTENVHQDAG